jgi:hypothetical protein
MAESPCWDADIGRFTTVDQGGTAPLRSPTPATAGSDRRGRHARVDVGGEDRQRLRSVGQTAIGNELTPWPDR